MAKITKGDKVTWSTPQGETSGTVTEKLTQDTDLAGKTYRASKEHPKVRVKSSKSGKEAIHNESSVDKK